MASLFRAGISRALPFSSSARAVSQLPTRGFEEFFDPNRQPHEPVQVGRAWSADELRRKSFEDLHKLWFVLYKERNVLLTEEVQCKRNRTTMPSPHRKRLVRKSMARIKEVLNERKLQQSEEPQPTEAASSP